MPRSRESDERPTTTSIHTISSSSSTDSSTYSSALTSLYGTGALAAKGLYIVGTALIHGMTSTAISAKLVSARVLLPITVRSPDRLKDLLDALLEVTIRKNYPMRLRLEALIVLAMYSHAPQTHPALVSQLDRWPRADVLYVYRLVKYGHDRFAVWDVLLAQLQEYLEITPTGPPTPIRCVASPLFSSMASKMVPSKFAPILDRSSNLSSSMALIVAEPVLVRFALASDRDLAVVSALSVLGKKLLIKTWRKAERTFSPRGMIIFTDVERRSESHQTIDIPVTTCSVLASYERLVHAPFRKITAVERVWQLIEMLDSLDSLY